MHAFLAFLFLVLHRLQEVRTGTCNEVKYTFINDTRRSTAFKSSSPYLCDRGIIDENKWYRFYSASGNISIIPSKNPGLGRCGTYVPIWFNGTYPMKENIIVNATACAAISSAFPPACGVSYDIKVVKCPGDYYLYKLKEPRQCALAYCVTMIPQQRCSKGANISRCQVPNTPPINVTIHSKGRNVLVVSWQAPDKRLWDGELTGYQVCYSTLENDKNAKCLTTSTFSYTISKLRSSTKYFLTVSAGTRAGYGKKSLEISKITNGEPVNPAGILYSALNVTITKPAQYIKEVMIVVQNAASSQTPSEDIQTEKLEPYRANMKDPYVTAYLKTDNLPFTFVIGDGKKYNFENVKYTNHPLKQNSPYIVFLRFFENQDLYYSTEWSSSVRTKALFVMIRQHDYSTSTVNKSHPLHVPHFEYFLGLSSCTAFVY